MKRLLALCRGGFDLKIIKYKFTDSVFGEDNDENSCSLLRVVCLGTVLKPRSRGVPIREGAGLNSQFFREHNKILPCFWPFYLRKKINKNVGIPYTKRKKLLINLKEQENVHVSSGQYK